MKSRFERSKIKILSLWLAVILVISMLPTAALAQSNTDPFEQVLENLKRELGQSRDQFVITDRKDDGFIVVTSDPMVDLGDKTVKLMIPANVTVKWGAKIQGSGSGYLIELSEHSAGTLELIQGATIENPDGEGIHVRGGVVSIKENINIQMNSSKPGAAFIRAEENGRVVMNGGSLNIAIPSGYGIHLQNGGSLAMSGGNIFANALESTGIAIEGSRSKAELKGSPSSLGEVSGNFQNGVSYGVRIREGASLDLKNSNIRISAIGQGIACQIEADSVLNMMEEDSVSASGSGNALKVTSNGQVNIHGGAVYSQQGAALVLGETGRADISGGVIRSEDSDVVSLSGHAIAKISGGYLSSDREKVLNVTGKNARVYITGGSLKGDTNGLTENNLKNKENGKAVYRVKLTGLPISSIIDEITSPLNYGIQDVQTDSSGGCISTSLPARLILK